MGRMMKIIAALFIALVLPARAAFAADYWVCVDALGHKTVQDHPCAEAKAPPNPRASGASSAAAAEPTPLVPELKLPDLAVLQRYLPWVALGLATLLIVVALFYGARRALQAWAEREVPAQEDVRPERIEPSEALRRDHERL